MKSIQKIKVTDMNHVRHILEYVVLLLFLGISCNSPEKTNASKNEAFKNLPVSERPNIVWIVAEDLSPVIESFGDSSVSTPNISRLASEGVRFTNFYSTHGVCAPSRSAIATGMYPASVGTNHMRTLSPSKFLPEGLVSYSAVLPPEVKMHSEYLRRAGYYCTNNFKEDYQFEAPVTAWDESSELAHYRNDSSKRPFFSIFNFVNCHESRMWLHKNHPLLADPSNVVVPPYYPDNDLVREELARMYSNVVEMDLKVGEVLDQLEEDGLMDNTIIFWYTDHGGPLPRQKREVYDAGLKVPLIVRFPDKYLAGEVNDEMISFIDLKPTLLSLAGIEVPEYVHGQPFLGLQRANPRRYIHAARDRLDTEYDRVRAVRDKRFKYIKNYEPEKPNVMAIAYRDQMTLMQELRRLDSLGELVGPQKLFFNESKPEEELYDCLIDPYEVKNLAEDPEYKDILEKLRNEHLQWVKKYGDKGSISEEELLLEMWPNKVQPITERPLVKIEKDRISITCDTEGASIAYQFKLNPEDPDRWEVYVNPIDKPEQGELFSMAHRIGFAPSRIESVSIN